jgi:hypothetical protein
MKDLQASLRGVVGDKDCTGTSFGFPAVVPVPSPLYSRCRTWNFKLPGSPGGDSGVV